MDTLSTYVLVIDDEEPVREAVEDILDLIDIPVLSAATATEGIRLFRQSASEIGLVVLDLHMPQIGGQEAYNQLKKIAPDIKVIFSSGYEKAEVARLLKLDGAELQSVMFLHKPYAIDSLLDLVQHALKPACPALE